MTELLLVLFRARPAGVKVVYHMARALVGAGRAGAVNVVLLDGTFGIEGSFRAQAPLNKHVLTALYTGKPLHVPRGLPAFQAQTIQTRQALVADVLNRGLGVCVATMLELPEWSAAEEDEMNTSPMSLLPSVYVHEASPERPGKSEAQKRTRSLLAGTAVRCIERVERTSTSLMRRRRRLRRQ